MLESSRIVIDFLIEKLTFSELPNDIRNQLYNLKVIKENGDLEELGKMMKRSAQYYVTDKGLK
ncbi:hypothetical protein IHV12_20155 [Fictibacillus sp. 7GRE50]|uniref:hypothetical protein n=1 Tax=Fictibacillus sp. 7GRE50 TaxID=2745878 RepID=UPI0018CE13CE|nr:hypothetical protein [Fictibacillus sp. 7GRE50]MBH0167240.1 hypothetical protein [Fictibacillus sp. 7GRE50]